MPNVPPAVPVAAIPCALAIATPSAVLAAGAALLQNAEAVPQATEGKAISKFDYSTEPLG